MSKIPFDPTATQGIRRNFRTMFTPRLLTGLLLAAVCCLGTATIRADESVGGKTGRANFRSVINFKGTAFLEQRRGNTNLPPHGTVTPFPKGAPGFADAAPPHQASTAPVAEQQGVLAADRDRHNGGPHWTVGLIDPL